MDDAPNVAPWPPGLTEGQPVVAFEFQMTPGLLEREMVANTFRRLGPFLALVFLFIELIELVTLDWDDPDFFELFGIPMLTLALVCCFLYWFARSGARRTFETTPLWQRPMQVVLTPTRLFTNGPGYESAQDLALLHAVRETRESFLVFLNSSYMLIWPKRSMPDLETLKRVRQYLREGLPGKAKIKLRDD